MTVNPATLIHPPLTYALVKVARSSLLDVFTPDGDAVCIETIDFHAETATVTGGARYPWSDLTASRALVTLTRREYRKGWDVSADPDRREGALDRADASGKRDVWYDGYYDCAAGRPRYHLVYCTDRDYHESCYFDDTEPAI